ncbi:glycerophosphodiester phosphodiesterase [Ferruginibacter sp.]
MKYFSIALFLGILFSCTTNKKMAATTNEVQKSPSGSLGAAFDKQGHRGCRGLMPENTIPAMIHALDLGVTTLEMDIAFTKDGVAILSHEPFFNHELTTKADGSFITEKEEKNFNIYKMSFAETQTYDVGLKSHLRFPQQQKMAVHKPGLAALFDSVKQYMATSNRPFPYFNIETKTQPATDNIYHPAPEAFVDMLMKVIKEKGMEDFVIIQSFDIRTLQYLHKKYPTVSTALLIEDYDKRSWWEQVTELGFHPSVYSPHYSLVSRELILHCKNYKTKVIPWTVNDKKEIERLKALGVDGIISDYPDLF